MSKRFTTKWAAAVIVSVALGSLWQAQDQDADRIQVYLEVEEGMQGDGRYSVYGRPERIDLGVRLIGGSDSPIWINDAALRRASVKVSLVDASGAWRDFPIRVEWRGIIEQRLNEPTVAAVPVPIASEQVLLDDQRAVRWVVTLWPAEEAQFTSGQYRVALGLADFRSAVRTFEGEAWRGDVPSGGSVDIVVRAPTTPEEWVLHYRQRGLLAEQGKRWWEALAAYSQMSKVDPSRPQAGFSDVGRMYLLLGRYEEAIAVLRQLPTTLIDSMVLGNAYVGAGDEASAIEVLRKVMPEGLAQDRLARARKLYGSSAQP